MARTCAWWALCLVAMACGPASTSERSGDAELTTVSFDSSSDAPGSTMGEEPEPEPEVARLEEAFVVDLAADILFVLDDSPSMAEHHTVLEAAVGDMLGAWDDLGVDYHVGVTTTELVGAAWCQGAGGFLEDGRLRELDGVRFVEPSTAGGADLLAQMVRVGEQGSLCEQGLGATWRALTEHRDGANAGFRREGAQLQVIVLSDEDDATDEGLLSLDGFLDWFADETAVGGGALHAVSCKREGSAGAAVCASYDVGKRYAEVVSATGGLHRHILDVTADHWVGLSEVVEPMPSKFTLSGLPVEDTVEVEVVEAGGARVAVPFDYDSETQVVTVVDPLQVGDEVVVTYAPCEIVPYCSSTAGE